MAIKKFGSNRFSPPPNRWEQMQEKRAIRKGRFEQFQARTSALANQFGSIFNNRAAGIAQVTSQIVQTRLQNEFNAKRQEALDKFNSFDKTV